MNENERKSIKLTAMDIQLNYTNPSHSFHKLDHAKDKHFWSVRVSGDLRLIVHRADDSLLLCYAGHHDDAYRWAERRRIEQHPITGAAQLVEIRETVREVEVLRPKPAASAEPVLLFASRSDEELLRYGVPADWLEAVKSATEDGLFDLAEHLPAEAAEALLELATGSTPQVRVAATETADPFEHPDAQRRFRLMSSSEELERALDSPWEKWMVFLHPAQRELVEKRFSGPARVAGSAGTGKTIVALHRAVYLVRQHPEARVLLTTFSEPLAAALRQRLRKLIAGEPKLAERLDVQAMESIGHRIGKALLGTVQIAERVHVEALLAQAVEQTGGTRFSTSFLWEEWTSVVDAWQLQSWDDYRDVRRLGRKTRLAETQRKALWAIFEHVLTTLQQEGRITQAGVLSQVADKLRAGARPPYDFAVVDEAQDISIPELRFLAALGGGRPDSLFFAGDLGQRIFQQPFSWSALGVEIRGRSSILRINYRTSHQIRRQADRLLAPELSDVDGNPEDRRGTISAFEGTPPVVQVCASIDAEIEFVSQWIQARQAEHLQPQEIAVFVRSEAELPRARAAVERAGLSALALDERLESRSGSCPIATMHLAKGLEFRAVVVMACDDEVLPSQERIESVTDAADLEDTYQTERHLLYVACTRARDHLLVSGVAPGSEFVDDLLGA